VVRLWRLLGLRLVEQQQERLLLELLLPALWLQLALLRQLELRRQPARPAFSAR
jgi:hypothetical protein